MKEKRMNYKEKEYFKVDDKEKELVKVELSWLLKMS